MKEETVLPVLSPQEITTKVDICLNDLVPLLFHALQSLHYVSRNNVPIIFNIHQ